MFGSAPDMRWLTQGEDTSDWDRRIEEGTEECHTRGETGYYPKIENDNELNMQVAKIDISEGDLLLFPSYLPHKVGVNESDEDRIVISFNIEITN